MGKDMKEKTVWTYSIASDFDEDTLEEMSKSRLSRGMGDIGDTGGSSGGLDE